MIDKRSHNLAVADRLRAHVSKRAEDSGARNRLRPQALHAAADYIRREWTTMGCRVGVQSYQAHGVHRENLEITLPGKSKSDQIVLIGAHYDAVERSPGANDNGSGVAALLEISRALVRLTPERSLRLVGFVNEEPPFCYRGEMGSMIDAKAARAPGDDLRLLVSLAMLGGYSEELRSQRYPPLLRFFDPDRGDLVAFVSNLRSRKPLRQPVQAFRAQAHFPAESLATFEFVPGVAWSDQPSFWRQGYPALMVTDTAFYRDAYCHSPLETPEAQRPGHGLGAWACGRPSLRWPARANTASRSSMATSEPVAIEGMIPPQTHGGHHPGDRTVEQQPPSRQLVHPPRRDRHSRRRLACRVPSPKNLS